VSAVNMATNSMLNSSRKIVIARHVSITAWLIRSLMRSTSASRSVPRNTCGAARCQGWSGPECGGMGGGKRGAGVGGRALVIRWYRQSASANAKLPLTAMAILEVDR